MRFLLPLLLALPALVACNPTRFIKPYTMEVQQGNFITQEQVSQLRRGMTKQQVRFLLGTPLLTDLFHADRWDYIFRRQLPRSENVDERRLTVFFKNDTLTHLEGDVLASAALQEAPPEPPPAQETQPAQEGPTVQEVKP